MPRLQLSSARLLRLAAIIVAGMVSGCGSGEPPPEFRIGLLVTTDVSYLESSSRPTREGAEMAASEINAAGGVVIDGRPHVVRIVVEEYEGRGDAASGARALCNRDSVHALVGPQLSIHAIPVSVIAEDVGVPMISPASSNRETTRGKDFVSRLVFLDEAQGTAIGRFAVESLGAERAAVLYDESTAYSRSVAAAFVTSISAAGGQVVAEETYTTDQRSSFEAQLLRIRDAAPEVLFLPNLTQDDSIQMREARALGIDAVFLGSDNWDVHALARLPEAEGSFVTHQWLAELAPEGNAFVERFRSVHGALPRPVAAMTYDAVMILATAATNASSLDGVRVARAIRALSDYTGVTGAIPFSGSGDPARGVTLATIRGGKIEAVGTIPP